MQFTRTRRFIDRWLILGLILAATGCGGTEGCSGAGAVPYPLAGLKVDSAVQAHITEAGFDALEAAIVPLLASQVPGSTPGNADTISICIPRTESSGFVLCEGVLCADQTEGCQVDLKVADVEINPINNGPGTAQAQSPDNVEVVVIVREFNETIPVKYDTGIGDIECDINASLDPTQNAQIALEAEIELKINSGNDRLEVTLLDDRTGVNLDDLDIQSTGICAITNFGFIQDFIKGQVNTILRPVIKDAADSALCAPCETNEECPTNSTCDTDKSFCVSDITDECIKRQFGAEGFFGLGDTLSDFAPEIGNGGLFYTLYPANYADAALGTGALSLGIQAGVTSDHNACVAYVPPPSAQAMGRSPELEAINTPGGQPFHVGIGLSERLVEHALWAAYNTGALCIEVGTSTVAQLSSTALNLFLRSISRLTGNIDAPVILKLFPRQPPTVRFGAGTTEVVNGETRLLDPLLTIELYNLDIDAYVFAFGRYVRVFTINTDLDVPLGITLTTAGELQILIGQTDELFRRVSVLNNELLSESKEDIAELIPTLVSNFLPTLLETLAAPIALPSLLGFKLNVVQTTGIGNNTIMGLFATLEYDPTAGGGLGMRSQTQAKLTDLKMPISQYLHPDGTLDWSRARGQLAQLAPVAEISLSAAVPAGLQDQVEYSYRINGGLWSLFSPSTSLALSSPAFLTPGHHTIEVRSRIQGQPDSLDLVPEQLDLLIDWAPPQIDRIDADDTQGAIITAFDDVDSADALSFRYRVGQAAWSTWTSANAVDLSDYVGQRVRLEVEARDSAGNVSRKHRGITLRSQSQALSEDPTSGPASEPAISPAASSPDVPKANDKAWGCTVSKTNKTPGSSSNSSGALLVGMSLLAAFGVVARRRATKQTAIQTAKHTAARLSVLSVIAFSLIATACDDDTTSDTDNICPEGGCVDTTEDGPCTTDADCSTDPLGPVCRAGVCGPSDRCTTAADCQEAQACIDTDGNGSKECGFIACADVSACAGVVCDDGNAIPKCFQDACVCDVPCQDGCPEGEYCCNAQDACQPLPDPCADLDCDPGFAPTVSNPGEPDPNACVVNNGLCACTELPPLDIGIHGIEAGMAASADLVAASSYNRTYGDLMLGLAPVSGGDMVWTFIDGTPAPTASNVEGSLTGPRGGVAAAGDDMGRHSSIAIAANNDLHISYQDLESFTLKYMHGTHGEADSYTWASHTIDTEGSNGTWTAIALHPTSGVPVIAYTSPNVDGTSRLRLAVAASPTPTSASDWTLSTLDIVSVDGPCAQACAENDFCRLDVSACETPAPAETPCTTPCGPTERCFAGDICAPVAWVKNSAVPDWAYVVAIHNRLVFDSAGLARVVYHDATRGSLKIVRQQADGSFAAPETLVDDSKRVGLWPSVVLDSTDGEHIVFTDWATRSVRYLNVTTATNEVVHNGRREDSGTYEGTVFLGADARLWLHNDLPRVALQNSSDMHLSLVERAADGTWTLSPLEGTGRDTSFTGSHGFYVNHANVDGKDYLLNMVINSQVDGRPILPKLHVHTLP